MSGSQDYFEVGRETEVQNHWVGRETEVRNHSVGRKTGYWDRLMEGGANQVGEEEPHGGFEIGEEMVDAYETEVELNIGEEAEED